MDKLWLSVGLFIYIFLVSLVSLYSHEQPLRAYEVGPSTSEIPMTNFLFSQFVAEMPITGRISY